MNLIFAGGCSIYGLGEIKNHFEGKSCEVDFLDAPFMAELPLACEDDRPLIKFTTEIPGDVCVVPLSEFWISWCIEHGGCKISQDALKSSRSKLFLYETMKKNGFPTPRIFENQNEARNFVLETGGKIVVKPIGLHSGYGVEILEKSNINMLPKYISEAENIHNRAIRIMGVKNEGVMLTESLSGTEFSADVFLFGGEAHIIRICKKKVALLHDKPCTLAYQLCNLGDFEDAESALKKWTFALFDKDDISYAQFDFMLTDKNQLVPLDFASRVGGGITELLMRAGVKYFPVFENQNSTFSNSNYVVKNSDSTNEHWIQLNYLSKTNGYIQNDNYALEDGYQTVLKRKGDYVISNPSSVKSRIATVVKKSKIDIQNLKESDFLISV